METNRETRTRQRAYDIWLAEGRPEGQALRHWLLAQRDIDSADQDGGTSPAVESLQIEKEKQKSSSAEDQLDEGLEGSFPASDPVSITQPHQERD